MKNSHLLRKILVSLPSCQLQHLHVSKQWKDMANVLLNRRIKDIVLNKQMKITINQKELKVDRVMINSDQMVEFYPKRIARKIWMIEVDDNLQFEFQCLSQGTQSLQNL